MSLAVASKQLKQLQIPQLLNKFFKSGSFSAKTAKTGLGLGVLGGGVALGTTVASRGLAESGTTISEKFGVPTELIFIIGVGLLVLLLLGMRK